MKCLICTACSDIRALHPDGEWTTCRCGACSARWVDPDRGTVVVRAAARELPRILGLNNAFLIPATRGLSLLEIEQNEGADGAWRVRHAIAINAPGYVFDKSHRACWACIVKVGETGDICWEDSEQKEEPSP